MLIVQCVFYLLCAATTTSPGEINSVD